MCYGAIDTKINKIDEMKSLVHREVEKFITVQNKT